MARGMKRPQGHRGLVDGGGEGGGGGGGGGITSISSPGGSVTVGNPTGPAVTVDVNAAAFPAVLFDMFLSYGHGMDVDANLPAATSFWLSPNTISDLARADQVREWEVDHPLTSLRLLVVISESAGLGVGLTVVVTVDGSDIALSVLLPDGVLFDTSYEAFLVLAVPAGSFIGVRVDGAALGAAASVRMQVRLIGLGAGGGGAGIPFVTHDFTLQGDGTALNPLGTKIRTITGLNGVDVSASSGNYNLRGSYVPNNGSPQAGLLTQDFIGVGRQFEATRQFVECPLFDALDPSATSLFDWFSFTNNWKTNDSNVVISGVWIKVHFLESPAGFTPPALTLTTDGLSTEITKAGALAPTAAEILQRFATSVDTLIPLPHVVFAPVSTDALINGTPGFGPGLKVSVHVAATNAEVCSISVLLALDLVSLGV